MSKEFDNIYWNDLKGKLKSEYPQLTNADLQWRHSTKEELLSMIALKLRKTTRELQEIIKKI